MAIGNSEAPWTAGTWHLWTFGVMVGSTVYRWLVELRGSVKGLVDSELLVAVDWSCLMGVALVVGFEARLIRLLVVVGPPLPVVTFELPFGLR